MNWFKRAKQPTPPSVPFTVNATGICTDLNDGSQLTILWERVVRITTYKLDLLTTDCVCLEITTDEGQLTMNEEIPGWVDLMVSMQEALPAINPTWYMDVMTPAFETNLTVIYQRAE